MCPAPLLPSPANLCRRWEGTTPMMVGYSDNNATGGTQRRRFGIAEVECDIEMDERAFKLDGHGRSFVGSRACPGDSGGPTLWRDDAGRLALGGVLSYTDTAGITDVACPSARGETGVAFIPRPFLDRTLPVLTVGFRGGAIGGVVSTPAGINCTTASNGCRGTFDTGTFVILHATPAPTSLFQGWSGACSGLADCEVQMGNGPILATATFVSLTQSLTVNVLPHASGHTVRIDPSDQLCDGLCIRPQQLNSTGTLTAQPAPGFVVAAGRATARACTRTPARCR